MQRNVSNEIQVSRLLHFVTKDGKCKPAIVEGTHPKHGLADLVVFQLFGTSFIEEVLPNHFHKVYRTWHWPKECTYMEEAI